MTAERAPARAAHGPGLGVEAEAVDAGYLQKRELRSGTAGWLLLAGLGVSAVISGDYAGWNFGLAEGGFGGLLIATVLMVVMYTAMVFGLAELGSALPTAGGGYTFAALAAADEELR
jgi:ethanolamine permease